MIPPQTTSLSKVKETAVAVEEKKKPDIRDKGLFVSYADLSTQIETEQEKGEEMNSLLFKSLDRKRERVRNELVLKNRRLVTYIVGKYYNKPEHKQIREDLLQEGTMGLMNAIDGFDVERGFRFSTYAHWWIRQAVNNYLANIEPTIKIPGHVRTAQNKLMRNMNETGVDFKQEFEEGLQREGKKLEYTDKMLHSIKCAMSSRFVDSMETPVSAQDGVTSTLKDIIPSKTITVREELDGVTLVDIIKGGLSSLSDRERNVLLLRFNVIDENEVTTNTRNPKS